MKSLFSAMIMRMRMRRSPGEVPAGGGTRSFDCGAGEIGTSDVRNLLRTKRVKDGYE